MNESPRSEVEANDDDTLPELFLKSSSTVRSACAYEPGPTCAAYSRSIDFLKRSSLFLNMESPPPIFSCAIAGSYSPAPGVCCFGEDPRGSSLFLNMDERFKKSMELEY